MELRHVRYFLAVAAEKNFSRAAARVGIAQPPLSGQIKNLETEIGARLFHRIPQGAELTAAGEAFFEAVKGFPALAERAVHEARRAARGERGSIRVGFTGTAAFETVVSSSIRGFRRAFPAVELTLEETNSSRLAEALGAGDLDVGFLRSASSDDERLQFRPLTRKKMLAVLPASHPAADSNPVRLEDLRDDAFVLTPREIGTAMYDAIVSSCRDAGFEPTIGQSAPQIISVISLVAAELGVSIVPSAARHLGLPGVVYRDIAGDGPTVDLSLAFRRADTSPVVRNFLALAST
ncbi:LysR family transcriptional regulator [Hansschlegelia sp. KR7-227]|jgi:DNA-binding transcriptional LysR family regulator|uniref:LysR family transcriptional regulator n=1 Tax=Hansschlegelia sp. KR7-227 TaxID=3400914 RepID=UPI003BFBE324